MAPSAAARCLRNLTFRQYMREVRHVVAPLCPVGRIIQVEANLRRRATTLDDSALRTKPALLALIISTAKKTRGRSLIRVFRGRVHGIFGVPNRGIDLSQ